MPALDILYPVRPGESNEELRYSLRSLSNLPHGKVWVIGHKPEWVTGVEYIEGGNSAAHARANLYYNLLAACSCPDMPDELMVFNDDFFVIGPVAEVPVLYRGLLSKQIKTPSSRIHQNWWYESLFITLTALQTCGVPAPVSYELHVPFRVNKAMMAQTLQQFMHVNPANPPQWRTLYGNMHAIGGAKGADGKAMRPGPLVRPFHSTDDTSWRYFRARFEQLFPEPSPYEIPPAANGKLIAVGGRKLTRIVTREQLRARTRV